MNSKIESVDMQVAGEEGSVVESRTVLNDMYAVAVIAKDMKVVGATHAKCVKLVMQQTLDKLYGEGWFEGNVTFSREEVGKGWHVRMSEEAKPLIPVVKSILMTTMAHVRADSSGGFLFDQSAYFAAYGEGQEQGREALIYKPVSGVQEAMDCVYKGKKRVDALKATFGRFGVETYTYTSTPQRGLPDNAITQVRPMPMQVATANLAAFKGALPVHRRELNRLWEMYVYTTGVPDQWFQRVGQINTRAIDPGVVARMVDFVNQFPVLVSDRVRVYLDPSSDGRQTSYGGYVSAPSVGIALNVLAVTPLNEKSCPGAPYDTPQGNSKAVRWAWHREWRSRVVQDLTVRLKAQEGAAITQSARDVFKDVWDEAAKTEQLLTLTSMKPKYDVYAGKYVPVEYAVKGGRTKPGLVPEMEDGKVRYYYVQGGTFRGMTTLATEVLGVGMRTFGNCVTQTRGGENGNGELSIQLADWATARDPTGTIVAHAPWVALGFCPYRGGMEAHLKLLMAEADVFGYGLSMYGDDSIACVKVKGHYVMVGGDASRFDLSQPAVMKQLFDAAFVDPLGVFPASGNAGGIGLAKFSLELTRDGLFAGERMVMAGGDVLAKIPGGTASGGRCLTESNSIVAGACMREIMSYVMLHVRSLPDAVVMTPDEAVELVRAGFLEGCAHVQLELGMKFGIEAIDYLHKPPSDLGPDAVGPIAFGVPFLGRDYRYATTSSGQLAVIGTLQFVRADRKIIFDTKLDDEPEELVGHKIAQQAASYYVDSGFVTKERSAMAHNVFKACGNILPVIGLPTGVTTDLESTHAVVRKLWTHTNVLRFHTGEHNTLMTKGGIPNSQHLAFGYRTFADDGQVYRERENITVAMREVTHAIERVLGTAPPSHDLVPVPRKLAQPRQITGGFQGTQMVTQRGVSMMMRTASVDLLNIARKQVYGVSLGDIVTTLKSGIRSTPITGANVLARLLLLATHEPGLTRNLGLTPEFVRSFQVTYGIPIEITGKGIQQFGCHLIGMFASHRFNSDNILKDVVAPYVGATDLSSIGGVEVPVDELLDDNTVITPRLSYSSIQRTPFIGVVSYKTERGTVNAVPGFHFLFLIELADADAHDRATMRGWMQQSFGAKTEYATQPVPLVGEGSRGLPERSKLKSGVKTNNTRLLGHVRVKTDNKRTYRQTHDVDLYDEMSYSSRETNSSDVTSFDY